MAKGRLSKREAAYRAKQAEKSTGRKASDDFEFASFSKILKETYSSYWWKDKAPKSPEELDAYLEGLEELQELEGETDYECSRCGAGFDEADVSPFDHRKHFQCQPFCEKCANELCPGRGGLPLYKGAVFATLDSEMSKKWEKEFLGA